VGLPSLTQLNARQNDLMDAFDFHQPPLPAPSVPVAPADTIAFHGSSDLSDIGAPNPGSALTINLEAETGGLTLDSGVSGAVGLTVTPPPGTAAPQGFPRSVTLTGDRGTFTVIFNIPGYYRIAATGPDGSVGWVTVDVGVTPNTAPTIDIHPHGVPVGPPATGSPAWIRPQLTAALRRMLLSVGGRHDVISPATRASYVGHRRPARFVLIDRAS